MTVCTLPKTEQGGVLMLGGWSRGADAKGLALVDLAGHQVESLGIRALNAAARESFHKTLGALRIVHHPDAVLSFPIQDFGVPKHVALPIWQALAADILTLMKAGTNVLIACQGGHGRTGLVAAIVLKLLVPSMKDPVEWLRTNYCVNAVETYDQHLYIAKMLGLPEPDEKPYLKATPAVGYWRGDLWDGYGDYTQTYLYSSRAQADWLDREGIEYEIGSRDVFVFRKEQPNISIGIGELNTEKRTVKPMFNAPYKQVIPVEDLTRLPTTGKAKSPGKSIDHIQQWLDQHFIDWDVAEDLTGAILVSTAKGESLLIAAIDERTPAVVSVLGEIIPLDNLVQVFSYARHEIEQRLKETNVDFTPGLTVVLDNTNFMVDAVSWTYAKLSNGQQVRLDELPKMESPPALNPGVGQVSSGGTHSAAGQAEIETILKQLGELTLAVYDRGSANWPIIMRRVDDKKFRVHHIEGEMVYVDDGRAGYSANQFKQVYSSETDYIIGQLTAHHVAYTVSPNGVLLVLRKGESKSMPVSRASHYRMWCNDTDTHNPNLVLNYEELEEMATWLPPTS